MDARKQLCLLPRNQLKMFNLLLDYSIRPDGVLVWLELFLEHAYANNVQCKPRSLMDIGGPTGETPKDTYKVSLVFCLTTQDPKVS